MPAWLPILKASLPYISQIVATTIPAFTGKPGNVDPVVAKQIEELQVAATNNAQSIHVLAEKLQQTIQGIDDAAAALQKQVALFKFLMFVTTLLAVLATAVAFWAVSR